MQEQLKKMKGELEWSKIPTQILFEEFRKRYLSGEINILTREKEMMLVDEKSKNSVKLTFK